MRRNTFIVTILGLFFLKGIAITSNVVGCRTCGGGGGAMYRNADLSPYHFHFDRLMK